MDETASTSDSGGLLASLSDLASSAVSGVGDAAVARVVGSISSPAPDPTAKAATPSSVAKVSVAGASLPLVLVFGAVLAFVLIKR